jgi:hypothetical protein
MAIDTCLRRLIAGIALAAGMLGTWPSQAADYSYRIVGKKLVIDISGRINEDEVQNFNAWKERVVFAHGSVLAAMPLAAFVLNSGGGSVSGALDMAAYVRQMHLDTGVSAGGTCSSSCFTVWAAGSGRTVAPDARIGVHSVTSVSLQQNGQSTTTTVVGDINMDGNRRVADALAAYGTPPGIIAKMTMTPPSGMYWFDTADYMAMHARVTR